MVRSHFFAKYVRIGCVCLCTPGKCLQRQKTKCYNSVILWVLGLWMVFITSFTLFGILTVYLQPVLSLGH